ncbi:hypothetical protein MtrunA17_Chr1g0164051 [Medicago truncatula]|uniref:Transmembrane protein n=1 Tax=Medicago truncatula TaxID=3880 RepID=A0A396JJA7_MEDTR|nr:hypothetical protein MtrunA17_Chr1g0164051 [Medicago truncatula]
MRIRSYKCLSSYIKILGFYYHFITIFMAFYASLPLATLYALFH